jgi:hypothetical protein
MKGKKTFSTSEIKALRELIIQRVKADRSQQKSIRAKMRRIGFYGQDDFGITDMQPEDLDNLIKAGRITVIGGTYGAVKNEIPSIKKAFSTIPVKIANTSVKMDFIKFDPETGKETNIPDHPGNYIVCLRPGAMMPDVGIKFKNIDYKGLQVIYTGIAGTSLRKRDYRQHFTGNNAGSSTLRKSLGSLFGFKKIPRDKAPGSRKTKFNETDEIKLSKWMKENLILYFAVNDDPDSNERGLINLYNPPLNISKNKNTINKEFRGLLSKLRSNI